MTLYTLLNYTYFAKNIIQMGYNPPLINPGAQMGQPKGFPLRVKIFPGAQKKPLFGRLKKISIAGLLCAGEDIP